MKRKNSRKESYYRSSSLFIVGVIGLLLLIYVGFGLVMTAIKADRLMRAKKSERRVPSEVGIVRRYTAGEAEVGSNQEVDVIVKEVFGKIVSIQGEVITVETKIYGDESKNIRLKLEEAEGGKIVRYETNERDWGSEVEMQLDQLEEGMYIGVKLPVEVLLSEIEKDLIYVDGMVIDLMHEKGLEE